MRNFVLREKRHLASLLQWEKGDRDSGGLGVTCVLCKANFIALCSHLYLRQNINREVRRSRIWHSSESESALERFEPVAAAMLWSDGQGTLFARVAARRQKEIKRGIDTHAPRMCQFPQCKTRLPWRQAGFIIIRDIPLPEVYPLSALSICG